TTGTYSDSGGAFVLKLPRDSATRVINFTLTGYEPLRITVVCSKNYSLGEIIMNEKSVNLNEITVTAVTETAGAGMVSIPVKEFIFMPTPTYSVEAMLRTLPGVASNNEMTNSYSVRGGNYDENLVYVNGIEVYRPFLIRSGQQEGLSFINPDLVESVLFSPGGFSASYGDKMSSVLDIRYRKPSENRGSVSAGLLYNSAHIEGISTNRKISFLGGVRHKSSRLMLNSLDSKGDYEPVFIDIQGVLSIKTGKVSGLSLLGSTALNIYNFLPGSRESRFGTEAEAYRLFVLFEGRERNRYESRNAAMTWDYNPGNTSHKFILSWFGASETEKSDIRGYYSLNVLDKNTGSENFTDTLMNIGTGSFLSHARNSLGANVFSAGYSGTLNVPNLVMKWGLKSRRENIRDNIREWKMVDSAGFSIPYNKGEELIMSSYISAGNNIGRWITEAFAETELRYGNSLRKYIATAGLRVTYNNYTGEILASPRVSFKTDFRDKYSVWLASGLYYQPPFHREMRYPDGSINPLIRSQRSFHTVAGMSHSFMAGDRPFKFTAEIYNKILSDIIPYRLDNVRIIYDGENSASGFSRGIELRLNGEFVEGAESWFSLSVMDSKLRIPGSIDRMFPSPSEQTVILNIYFQDYLPGNPSYRAHINISFATGLPVTSPFNSRYDKFHRMPPYRRVDLGMTRVFRQPLKSADGRTSIFREIVAGIEVFNLL
ncbi:MAG: TonB-dependent receptor plug domain-containing protein, partial [Bacteroidales bacterium]|nr:TonB-dependent receptor plug domain-containing protein [Bacteroidales bacterium]